MRGARIRARFYGAETVVTTDEDGYFRVEMAPGGPLPPGNAWHRLELAMLAPERVATFAEVYVPERGQVVVSTHEAGELVGWSWLFPPYRWQFDGRAAETTHAIMFDGACLRGKCDADHQLGYLLMQRFAARMLVRLQDTRLRLLDVYGHAPAG